MKFQDFTNQLSQGGNFLDKLYGNQNFISGIGAFNPGAEQPLIQRALLQRQQQEAQRQQEAFEMQKAEASRKRSLEEKLPGILAQVDWNKPKEAQAKLASAGLKPQEIGALFNVHSGGEELGLKKQDLKLKEKQIQQSAYNQAQDRDYKQQLLQLRKQESLQKRIKGNKLDGATLRANQAVLQQFSKESLAAESELKEIQSLKKAYASFDKATGSHTGSGSLYSSLIPTNADKESTGWLSPIKNVIKEAAKRTYSDEAQNSLAAINKVNQRLVEARAKGMKNPTNESNAAIAKSLPNVDVPIQARQENIHSMEREAFKKVVTNRFIEAWSKENGRDLTGASTALEIFLENAPLFDENGELNKEVLAQIPAAVKELTEPAEEQQGFENYDFDFE